MTIYSLFIYDAKGRCLYYQDWNHTAETRSQESDQKLMYGLLFSLKVFAQKMSPREDGTQFGVKSYKTNAYKLHLFETASGFKFVMTTDPGTADVSDVLNHIYSQLFLDYVVKNPLYERGTRIEAELFHTTLQNYIRSHPAF